MKRLLVGVCLFAAACGGNDAAPTPAVPAASVSGIGEGSIVLHPSADTRFAVAIELPVRVRENSDTQKSGERIGDTCSEKCMLRPRRTIHFRFQSSGWSKCEDT